MSALSALYVVLPIFVVSLCHALEVVFTAKRWVGRRWVSLMNEHPNLLNVLFRLSGMNVQAFLVASVSGFLTVLLATAALFASGRWTERIWTTVFMAYSACVLISIVRAVVLKGYAPGLVTSIISVPLIAHAAFSLSLVWPWWEMLLFTVVGLALTVANFYFAQRVGQRKIGKDPVR